MSSMNGQRDRLQSGERGSIVVMTAILMLLFMVMLGLAIDVSRIYMVRAELQNAADAAALTAARELNSGTTGIDNAVARANNIVNTQGFGKVGVSIASVEFAINLNDDPYMNAASAKDATTVKNIRFVRVTTQATTTNILFAVSVLGTSHAESRTAVAGMSVGINGICNYFPVALAKDDPTSAWPTGTQLVLKFKDNSSNTITLQDMQYMVLNVPLKTGGGTNEIEDAMAGGTALCTNLDALLWFSESPSANNPKHMSIGTNTRLDLYGGSFKPCDVYPDLNVNESITLVQYQSGSPKTAPTNCPKGESERRLLVLPVIKTVVDGPKNGKVEAFRAFFLKQKIDGQCKSNCPPGTTAPGDIVVEYAGDDFVVGSGYYDPNGIRTNLTVAVLYK